MMKIKKFQHAENLRFSSMKKIIVLMIFLILIGCTGIPYQRKDTIQIPSVYQGTKGIEMKYLDQMPPYELFENQLFEIGLELHNAGATDVQNGIYNIAVNEQYLTLLDEKMNRFNAKGKSMYSPFGDKERISVKVRTNELAGKISGQSTTIITNTCYEYETKATIMTCIDTDLSKKETKVCQVRPITESGQGAPVAVVRVEPRMPPHEDPNKVIPTYTIQIENRGTGQVIGSGSVYDACVGRSLEKDQYDTVLVNAMLSEDVLHCSPPKLKLRQKENKILCKLEQGIDKNMGNYQTPLIIELSYGYVQTLPKSVRITKHVY